MIDPPPTEDAPSRTPAEIEALTSAALDRADRRIQQSLATSQPSFETLFGALDDAARVVAIAYGQGAFLKSVDADKAVRDAASDAHDRIEKWRSSLPQREDVASAVEAFAASSAAADLDIDQASLLRHWVRDIRHSGAPLAPDTRAEVQRLYDRLVEIGGAFVMNLARVASLELTREELDGVPEHIVASFEDGATPGTVEVPLHDGIAMALLEHARRRDVRERADRGMLNRGMPENRGLLEEAVAIRRRLAGLLGYRSWLDMRAEGFAAEDAATIERFIADVAARVRPAARAELAAMREILLAEPGAPADLVVEDWDWRYADSHQRASLGGDPARLRDYLAFDDVFAGLCAISEAMFGIRLVARPDRHAWHPDVRAFDLVDRESGAIRGRLFFDPFLRAGKQATAFAEMIDPGSAPGSEPARPPTIALVTSFSEPRAQVSLLGPTELDILFHEYGHVLDFALPAGPFVLHRFESWVPMDWVEGPSQFLGRWGQHPEVLATFARHHETGDPIPPDLLAALERLDSLNRGVRTMRHLAMGRLDVLLHGEGAASVDEADRDAWLLREIARPDATCFPASLIHLLAGYDGAIYGFVWSQVLRDDLLSRFELDGLTAPATGAAYRAAILEAPWTRNPLDGLNAFLGRPWSIDAFMARVGGSPETTLPTER